MRKYFKIIDEKILKWINVNLRNKFFDKIMPIITAAGNLGIVWVIISVFLLAKRDYRLLGKMIITALIITTIIGEGIIKHIIERERPFSKDKEKQLTNYIFISIRSYSIIFCSSGHFY